MKCLVILAGGKSTRMGRDKLFLRIGEESFLERIFNNAVFVFDKIIFSTDTEEHGKEILSVIPDAAVIVDRYKDCGPIGGLLTVMEEIPEDKFAVVPADVPNADMKVLDVIYGAVPEGKQAMYLEGEPLIGVYTRYAKEPLRRAVENADYKVRRVLYDAAEISEEKLVCLEPALAETDFAESFRNINDQEDYLGLL